MSDSGLDFMRETFGGAWAYYVAFAILAVSWLVSKTMFGNK